MFQGIQKRTLALRAARLALRYQFLKGQFKAIQLPDLGIHIGNLVYGMFADIFAGAPGADTQRQQLSYFVERESQLFGFLDKPKPLDGIVAVHPVT